MSKKQIEIKTERMAWREREKKRQQYSMHLSTGNREKVKENKYDGEK